jgi:hypothetical protein
MRTVTLLKVKAQSFDQFFCAAGLHQCGVTTSSISVPGYYSYRIVV